MDNNGSYHNGGNPPPGNGSDNGNGRDDDNIIRLPTPRERARAEKNARRAAQQHEPMINLPPVTKIFLGLFLAVHLFITSGLDDVDRYGAFEHFGLVSGGYTGAAPVPLWSLLIAPFSYSFLHGSWLHLGMNGAMMMAFGAGCERWLGALRFTLLFFACALAAAAVQFAWDPSSTQPVIGASGGLSGLFAAVLVMMQRRGMTPGRYGIWPFALVWVGISVIFGLIGGPDGSVIAWPAHIGGFLAGFAFMRLIRQA